MKLKQSLAKTGIAVLFLAPFSLIPVYFQFFLAFAFGVVSTVKVYDFYQNSRLCPKPNAVVAVMVSMFIYGVILTAMSFFELLLDGDMPFVQMLRRGLSQQVSLVLSLCQVMCGFFLARFFCDESLRKIIFTSMIIMVLVASYQLIAVEFGLPFIGNFVDDKFVGLRPSSLAVEPKYLAGYLACVLFFLAFFFREASPIQRLSVGIVFCLAAMFFVQAASANGFIAILSIMFFLLFVIRLRWRIAFALIVFGLLALGLSGLDLDELGLRGSHKELLENITKIDLSLLDDLIALPILAWLEHPWKAIFGFGPGMMHFFAYRFMNHSTWLTDETYIEGNVSLLMHTSNFGLIIFVVLSLIVWQRAVRLIRSPPEGTSRSTVVFFATAFVTGATVSGNQSIPFFLAIGWLLFKQPQAGRREKSPLVRT